jgi:hypothetical protein
MITSWCCRIRLINPLTALSIFVPLITAALAAFIPQLGTS